MKIKSEKLIEDLLTSVNKAKNSVLQFKQKNLTELNVKLDQKKWSALECIEHLNLYGDYYLPEIEARILKQNKNSNRAVFKSGIIGNYFASLMKTNNGKIKKMQTPAEMNPINSGLNTTALDRFLKQLEKLAWLLNEAKEVDLQKTKTSIKLTKLIKLRLGDTLRFVVYHIERHIEQAEKAIK